MSLFALPFWLCETLVALFVVLLIPLAFVSAARPEYRAPVRFGLWFARVPLAAASFATLWPSHHIYAVLQTMLVLWGSVSVTLRESKTSTVRTFKAPSPRPAPLPPISEPDDDVPPVVPAAPRKKRVSRKIKPLNIDF